MWLARNKLAELASSIAKSLVERKLIETESIQNVGADVSSVLEQYLKDEEEISNRARDLAAARGLPPSEAMRMKRELAKQRGIGVGDDAIDYVLDQLLEMLMHSASVEEIFGADHDLKRAMREPMRDQQAATDKLDETVRNRMKHVTEGTPQWEIEYRRIREEIARRRGS